MSISLKTNIASLSGQRHLNKTNGRLQKSLQRLSSGYRINTSMDDAAGMGVSERMRSQIRGLNQAERNANDGLSIVQTAEGAMAEVSNILIRMRELSVQAASDSITDTDRGYVNTEFQDLISEIDRVSNVVEYNGIKLEERQDLAGLRIPDGATLRLSNWWSYTRRFVLQLETPCEKSEVKKVLARMKGSLAITRRRAMRRGTAKKHVGVERMEHLLQHLQCLAS